ncbi:hypothetical protein L1987_18785 [Smallanthus sonchifolius]|uniref:Uncharacterized protein n=1 Tax=Smallanthus sonchifolius TaxID=185202 RepID=A0ACB9J0Q4_9ASTR|nr:hypothetical protein L1987_18785 [Smallanthus sonchifolius]
MKTETLKKVVNDMKFEKEIEKRVQIEKRIRKRKENSKKRIFDVYTSSFDTQKSLFEARLKELDATKLKPNVKVEEVSKEIYSTNTAEASVKVSEESKGTWFKKKLESSSRMVDSFEIGIENFSSETLKEKIISWRYDSSKDLYIINRTRGKHQVFKNKEDIFKLSVFDLKTLSEIKMLTTHLKGYDFENFLEEWLNMDFTLNRRILRCQRGGCQDSDIKFKISLLERPSQAERQLLSFLSIMKSIQRIQCHYSLSREHMWMRCMNWLLREMELWSH